MKTNVLIMDGAYGNDLVRVVSRDLGYLAFAIPDVDFVTAIGQALVVGDPKRTYLFLGRAGNPQAVVDAVRRTGHMSSLPIIGLGSCKANGLDATIEHSARAIAEFCEARA